MSKRSSNKVVFGGKNYVRIPVPQPALQLQPPVIDAPRSTLDPRAIGPMPGVLTNDADQIDQFTRPGVSQFRSLALPSKSNPAPNAASASVAKPVATAAATTTVGKALPGTVSGTTIKPATLNNVADSTTRYAREAVHSVYVPTSNPLSSTDAGSSATASIAAFTSAVGGSGGTVSYGAGSITGLSYGTLYYITTVDSTLSGNASPSYSASLTKPSTVNSSSGNIFIGSITTAVSGGSAVTGNNDGGSAGTNQTGATIGAYAAGTAAVTGGGFANATLLGGSGSVSSGTTSLAQEWGPFIPAPNDNLATSKVASVHFTFTLSSALAAYTISYSANTGSGTLASGSTSGSGFGTATLPAGTDLTTLSITATLNYSSGAGHATLAVSQIKVIETS
jgi:hypothetical protein